MALRVLLIDDDARLFELLARYLGENDVALRHAPDGPRGLQALAAGGFDVVLLDGMMPGQDGISVLKKIREHDGIPIVMLTAKGDEADRVVGLELGADDYVAKPFSPRELLARIRRWRSSSASCSLASAPMPALRMRSSASSWRPNASPSAVASMVSARRASAMSVRARPNSAPRSRPWARISSNTSRITFS